MSTNKKAVINGEIQYLSVSSITKYDPREQGGCPRRWYYRYVLGIPEPANKAFADGQAFHSEIERYLKDGTDHLSPVTRAGKHYLPLPTSVDIEVDLSWLSPRLTIGDIPIEGRIDCINRSSIVIDSEGEQHAQPDHQIEVIDWKSTSDLSYAKRGEALATVQMIGYGEAMRISEPRVSEVRLSQVFFQKKGKRAAIKHSLVLAVDDIKERWQSYQQITDEMKRDARAEGPEFVAPNLAACSAFNGCPYKSFCPLSKTQVIQQAFGGSDMGILDKIKAGKVAAQQAASTPTPAPVAPAPTVKQEIAKLEAEEQRAVAAFAPLSIGSCPKCGEEVTKENGSRTPSGRVVHTLGCSAENIVVPNDAPSSEPPLSAQALPPDANVAPAIKEIASPWGEVSRPDAVIERAALPKEEIEAPAKKTRAPKSEKAAPAPVWDNGLQLFVDCTVAGVNARSLDEYINAAHETLRKLYSVSDIRCAIDKQSPLAFGGWKGVLAAYVRDHLPESGAYTLSDVRESEIKQVIVEAVSPSCAVFVRGVR